MMVAKTACALGAILLLAACKAQEPANQANTAIPSAEAQNTANSAPPTHEQALAMMHQRHEDMEAFGDQTKAIGKQLKSSSPDIAVGARSAEKTIWRPSEYSPLKRWKSSSWVRSFPTHACTSSSIKTSTAR